MTPTTRARIVRAATAVAGSASALVVAAGPARADNFTEPTDTSFGTLDALLLFVGVPLLVIAVVSLLVYAPQLARGPRYRPGRPYEADPLLVDGGPAPGAKALPPVPADQARAGGASAGW